MRLQTVLEGSNEVPERFIGCTNILGRLLKVVVTFHYGFMETFHQNV